jgi:hypothetical protein
VTLRLPDEIMRPPVLIRRPRTSADHPANPITFAVGYCRPRLIYNVGGGFVDGLCDYFLNGRHDLVAVHQQNWGADLAVGWNLVVDRFLAGPGEYLFMIDADMTFTAATMDKLLDAAAPDRLTGGLCFVFDEELNLVKPTIYRATYEATRDLTRDSFAGFRPELDYPADQLVAADATGMAFLAIPRACLEAMRDAKLEPLPYYDHDTIDGVRLSEDTTFCLRAKAVGWPLRIHTGVSVGHDKRIVIFEGTYKAEREDREGRST